MSAAAFNECRFSLPLEGGAPELLPDTLVLHPEADQPLPGFTVHSEIEIEIECDTAPGEIWLRPTMRLDDGTELCHLAEVLDTLTDATDLLPRFGGSAEARRQLAYAALWALLLDDGARQEEVLEALSAHSDRLRNSDLEDIGTFLEAATEDLGALENPHAEVVVMAHDGRRPWGYVHDVMRGARRLAAVVGATLGEAGDWTFWDDGPAYHGDASAIGTLLPALIENCRAHGIALRCQSQAVSAASFDFQVAADPGARAIDWFELRPEVTCDGFEIPPERWNEILGGCLINLGKGGGFRVVSPESVKTLARMRAVYERTTGRALGRTNGRDRAAADSGEAARVPRLQILDWIALARDGVKLDIPAGERAVLDALLEFRQARVVPLPGSLRATLRPYQEQGFQWLAFLYEHRFGACLADDMGLGKTLQAIALLAAIGEGLVRRPGEAEAGVRTPHLIVLPPTLVFNWQSEIERFAPGLRVLEYTGADRKGLDFTGADVVLTTYELVRRDLDELKERQFDVVIFDEAQAVKNDRGERSKAVRLLPSRFRLCLTGTPMENHVGEFHSIIELALPGLLGDRRQFVRDATKDPECAQLCRARPFLLRRTKEKILDELPPKVESNIHLELTKRQKEIYSRTVAAVRAEVAVAFADKAAQQAGIVALAALTRLRQVCISPVLLDPDYRETAPKLEYLALKLAELAGEGHAALVFSQFTRALDAFEHTLRASALPFQRLDGKTPTPQRRTLVNDFQSGKGPGLFLISLKTGGSGLNLTRAAYVFHLDPWWNPAVENQASDRAHRIGQTQTVFVTRLLMRHTIEEKMMELKARKQEIYDQIINRTASQGAGRKGNVITREDMDFLLGS